MSNSLSQSYRSAFVTGASTGLGRAFAEMLLREGVQVWGTSRDLARLADLSAAHAGFHPVALELGDGDAAEQAFIAAESAADGFDIVINNAGFSVFGEFAETEFSAWEDQIRIMLVNTARLAHVALRCMGRRPVGGRRRALVNISSLAVEFPLPFQAGYNICKAGLTALNESLLMEYSGSSIVILDVRPGDYRTEFGASVHRTSRQAAPRLERAWRAFEAMMRSGPDPRHAAESLRRALLRGRSGTVRTGRLFQAVAAPFLSRFGSLGLKRRVQARYFDIH